MPPLQLAWEYEIDGEVRSPTIANGHIYFASLNGKCYCLNLEGRLVWTFTADSRNNASLMIHEGLAYFGSNDSHFYCLDATTGVLVWKQKAQAAIQGNFAAHENLVMCGSYDNGVYAFDARTGDPAWRADVGSGVNCSLAVMHDAIYLGTNGGTVHALDARTGAAIWRVFAPGGANSSASANVSAGGINATCAVSARGLFVGTRLGQFCKFDWTIGHLDWLLDFGAPIFASPALEDEFVYSASDLGTLRKVRVSDGALVWEAFIGKLAGGQVWTSPLVAGDVVYAGPALGWIRAFDKHTGAELWRYPVGGPSSSSIAIGEGVLVSSTGGNRLLVFRA